MMKEIKELSVIQTSQTAEILCPQRQDLSKLASAVDLKAPRASSNIKQPGVVSPCLV
jgi:hypothetical protein